MKKNKECSNEISKMKKENLEFIKIIRQIRILNSYKNKCSFFPYKNIKSNINYFLVKIL